METALAQPACLLKANLKTIPQPRVTAGLGLRRAIGYSFLGQVADPTDATAGHDARHIPNCRSDMKTTPGQLAYRKFYLRDTRIPHSPPAEEESQCIHYANDGNPVTLHPPR